MKGREIFMTRNFQMFLNQLTTQVQIGMESVENTRPLVQGIVAKLDEYQAWIKSMPPGPARAQAIHSRLNAMVKLNKATKPEAWKQVSCKKGCWGCCMQRVDASKDEIDLLAEAVEKGQVKIDREKLAKQALIPNDPDQWWAQPDEDKTCIFLGADRACMVYDKRPMACRNWIVRTPAERCYAKTIRTDVAAVVIMEHEILATAACDLDRTNTTLAFSLNQRLGQKEQKQIPSENC